MNLRPGVKGKPAVGGKGLASGDGGGDPSKSKGKPAVGGEGGGGKGQQDLFELGGLWFGHDFRLPIEGPEICGRYIAAKKALKLRGEARPLPYVFFSWGQSLCVQGQGKRAKASRWRH